MTCNHKNVEKKILKRSFKDNTFKIEGMICNDCGGEIWDSEMNNKFHSWLINLEFDNIKQYSLSDNVNVLLKEFMNQIHCEDEGQLVRSIIAVMNARLSNKECNSIFNDVMDSEDFKQLETDKLTISKKVRITKVNTLYDFEVWRDIAGLSDSEMIRTQIMIILVMSKNKNTKFSEFWDNHFKDYLAISLAS